MPGTNRTGSAALMKQDQHLVELAKETLATLKHIVEQAQQKTEGGAWCRCWCLCQRQYIH